MKVLDCENVKTTLKSLINILGISEKKLAEIFLSEDWNNLPNAKDCLFERVRKNSSSTNFDGVFWFHATRIKPNYQFLDGLLPLNQNTDFIFNFLFSLINDVFTKTQWDEFKDFLFTSPIPTENTLYSNSLRLIRTKIEYNDVGPYAGLVRDIFFYTDSNGQSVWKNFTRIPEFIEQVCEVFDTKYNFNMMERTKKSTRGCIVKFLETNGNPKYLKSAIYYLCFKCRNFDLSIECTEAFNGQGEKVLPEKVQNIEWI